jgi:hypothetical protein
VGFVDDVDLEAGVDGGEDGAFAQFAGVVDAAVAGGVDLDDVDGAVAVGGEGAAGAAFAAGLRGGPLGAVEGAGEDARGGGLAAAAGAGEQVGVVEAPGADGVDERFGDVLLADDFGEGLRPVFAVQRECHVILQLTGALGSAARVRPGSDVRRCDRRSWCGRHTPCGPGYGRAFAGLIADGAPGSGRCRLVARTRLFRASEGWSHSRASGILKRYQHI